jgi:sortase (surface protein transpeptidase)
MKPSVVLCAVTMAVVAVLTSGCQSGQSAAAPDTQVRITGPGAPIQPAGTPSETRAAEVRAQGVLPGSVRIPRINAESSLVPLGQNTDGTVQVPPVSTPLQAGWYAGGAAPGEPGPAVLLGHVDGDKQLGIFYRLHELTPGDQVMVTRQDGTVLKFSVTKVDRVAKTAFPTDAVYGPTKDPELRLLTCGGKFDHAAHSYVDNVIVYAKLVT